MQTLSIGRISLLTLLSVFLMMFLAPGVVHSQVNEDLCRGAGGTPQGGKCVKAGTPDLTTNTDTSPSIFRRVADVLLFLVGATSVIMLIVGGIRYTLSNGDQQAVATAKDTILYAIIGIIVAFLAFAAVSFIEGRLTG